MFTVEKNFFSIFPIPLFFLEAVPKETKNWSQIAFLKQFCSCSSLKIAWLKVLMGANLKRQSGNTHIKKKEMSSHGRVLYFILYFALSVVILTWFTTTFTLIQATAASCDEIWYCCLSLVYSVRRWWLWMDAVASVCLCGFRNDFSEGAVTTDSGSAFHVSTILLLKLLLLISLRSSSLRLCPLVGLSLENVNLVYLYLLRLFYL